MSDLKLSEGDFTFFHEARQHNIYKQSLGNCLLICCAYVAMFVVHLF